MVPTCLISIKCFRTVIDNYCGSRRFIKVREGLQGLKMVQGDSKRFKKVQEGSRRFKMNQE